jgi:phosphoadenylyl-sulfate reductase (thioredoxin)
VTGDISLLEAEFSVLSPRRAVQRALERYGDELVISFSGAEDVLLLEYAATSGHPFHVLSLDTGRLHPETYRYFQVVAERYQIRIEFAFPDAAAVEQLVRAKGLFSFYEDGHAECCAIRKVEPLRRHLAGRRAWITGQRRDQSPGTRAALAPVEPDPVFRGEHDQPVLKFSPLYQTTSAEVWAEIEALGLPYNPLHARGMVSIGCEPCTRPILPGQHERDGRWWWENVNKKECGLHRPT